MVASLVKPNHLGARADIKCSILNVELLLNPRQSWIKNVLLPKFLKIYID